ncbi:MAG: DUF3131 domain-containing protein [Fuscovulum sp.]|nr:DUF3131 domain-containing protein [Fuscovulum sp.]
MRRRSFLTLLAAGPLAAGTVRAQEIVPPPPTQVLVTISGIGAATDAGALGSVLSTLVVRGVPVNLVVDTTATTTGLGAQSEIAQLIRHYSQSFPGLVEIVAWAADLGSLPPYRAARLARETRRSLFATLFPGQPTHVLPRPVQCIACKAPLDSNAASATLSAGFRCVLELPVAGPDFRSRQNVTMTARLDRFGLLSLLGGERTPIARSAAVLAKPWPEPQRHLILDAAEISGTPADQLATATQDIARLLSDATLDLSMLPILASDVQMRSETAFRRRVALHVLAAPDDEATGVAAALARVLAAQRIPFSQGPVPAGGGADLVSDLSYWVPLDTPAEGDIGPDTAFASFPSDRIALAGPGAARPGDTRFGIVVRAVRDAGDAGLTRDAEFAVPILAVAGAEGGIDGAEGLHLWTQGDGVVLVIAAAFRDDAARNALVVALRKALVQPDIQLVTLPRFGAEAVPKEPLLPMLLLGRGKVFEPASAPEPPDADEQAALMQDAQSAWGYFAANTNASTGLCPATAFTATGPGADFVAVSMWEIGSHLNALIAAVDLGLISDEEFTQSVGRIIGAVDRASRKRLVLPPETIDSGTGKGTTRFNSFDTARLLIALHRVAAHRLAPKGIPDLVASWDFAAVLRGRRLHSRREGKLIDDYSSNYALYAASGMRLWGYDVVSPMDEVAGLGSADAQERLLALTSSFGVLGAEPTFLHLLEMDSLPAVEFLADCLDGIQRRFAARAGLPAAPSESPLDRSPWFTYQGFDLRRPTDPWRVEFAAFATDATWQDKLDGLKATSTKAAYLWLALRPNAQSRALVRSMRSLARHDLGFDSAVYYLSQKSTLGYSDLNTNAVVLQSVARLLRTA